MPLFSRRKDHQELLLSTPGPGMLPANQVAAKLRVIAVVMSDAPAVGPEGQAG